MVCLLKTVIWSEEALPRQWIEDLIFKKGDKDDPRNYTLPSVVGKVFFKVFTVGAVFR